MVSISKEQVEWLIEHGYLEGKRGQYPDLAVTSRFKNSKHKHRWVNENVAKYLPKVENTINKSSEKE